MNVKHILRVKLGLAAFLLLAVLPAFSQVTQAVNQSGGSLVVGVGYSRYYTGMIKTRLEAPTVWADWSFVNRSKFLSGLGIEAEIRDLDLGQPGTSTLRQFTAGGGPIYTCRHFRNVHPYAKFLVDYGMMDHFKINTLPASYDSDKWTIYAPGGGVEYRTWRNVWVRADYEYQFWPVDFHSPSTYLNPNGVTVGVSYDLSHIHGQ
jgi:opacity protein-like surface antigen